jgi:hypothetical protein
MVVLETPAAVIQVEAAPQARFLEHQEQVVLEEAEE